MPTKNKFFYNFFCILFFNGSFTSVFNRSHKTVEIKGFSYFFCLIMEGSGSIQITTDPDPEGPRTYGSGSTSLVLRVCLRKVYFLKVPKRENFSLAFFALS
jgi:hypothetical protein